MVDGTVHCPYHSLCVVFGIRYRYCTNVPCLRRYEQRNVGIIRFVVMLVMAVIGLLVLYLIVVVLEPIVMKRWHGQSASGTTHSRHNAEEVPVPYPDSNIIVN